MLPLDVVCTHLMALIPERAPVTENQLNHVDAVTFSARRGVVVHALAHRDGLDPVSVRIREQNGIPARTCTAEAVFVDEFGHVRVGTRQGHACVVRKKKVVGFGCANSSLVFKVRYTPGTALQSAPETS